MATSKTITQRNLMMAWILRKEKMLIPTTNGAGERVYVLTEEAQDALEGMSE